jgi:hypothetical protein
MWRALLVLLLLTGPAMAHRPVTCGLEVIPKDKQQRPTVLFDVLYVDRAGIKAGCESDNRRMVGCTRQIGRNYWQIYILERPDVRLMRCVLLHEYAHLPPNNWKHD